jgi:hypothetical protein
LKQSIILTAKSGKDAVNGELFLSDTNLDKNVMD